MDDWGGLENRCGLLGHRGFESHPLRWRTGLERDPFFVVLGVARLSVGSVRLAHIPSQLWRAAPPGYNVPGSIVLKWIPVDTRMRPLAGLPWPHAD